MDHLRGPRGRHAQEIVERLLPAITARLATQLAAECLGAVFLMAEAGAAHRAERRQHLEVAPQLFERCEAAGYAKRRRTLLAATAQT